ncbi:hypothetical protein VOLCADRAFT_90294 [Volvox carteri f. nagariensis]|uniref:Uncharacterized protein n=1 Tax=Volvox carteri f. nagariensis TaxID=3068 RepID=D8TTZ9_VOLCA|nr:uncharacterized protein VOLCADRAFT_90294 [Volvox carteri f. nagariensis]EFJ49055.1 hypothetical protein VOLCADRAFT_90294 [Volvox carteri f. nagariensis]|eukprot:XP_002949952.1 hypothetical protein VOLCADRAFT_90294 [Volvox carteri f. nagariensis]
MPQVKAQAQARIAELEAALGPARQVLVPPPLHPVTSVGASGQTQQQQLQQQPSLPAALSANNPFAGAFPTAPSYISMPPPPAAVAMGGGGGGGTFASLGVPPPPPPAASATTQVPAQPDFFSAFDDLARQHPSQPRRRHSAPALLAAARTAPPRPPVPGSTLCINVAEVGSQVGNQVGVQLLTLITRLEKSKLLGDVCLLHVFHSRLCI